MYLQVEKRYHLLGKRLICCRGPVEGGLTGECGKVYAEWLVRAIQPGCTAREKF